MAISTVGVDVGQKRDPTALVIADIVERETGEIEHVRLPWENWHVCTWRCRPKVEVLYVVRFLGRLPLGWPYPRIVEAIAEAVDDLHSTRPGVWVQLYVDSTGVGSPVVDLLRQRIRDHVIAVTLVRGEQMTRRGRELRLGKAFLVNRLQVLFQQGKIWLPQTQEAQTLAQELLDFEIRVDRDGADRYGAFRVGRHDDLVIALGLATLYDPSEMGVEYMPSLYD